MITTTDTCDQCCATAQVTVKSETGGELAFCSHHFTVTADRLLFAGWTVTEDTREALEPTVCRPVSAPPSAEEHFRKEYPSHYWTDGSPLPPEPDGDDRYLD